MGGTTSHTEEEKPVRPNFKGRRRVRSRYAPRYPISAEREYRRVNRAYYAAFERALKAQLPTVMRAYRKEMAGGMREDGLSDFMHAVKDAVHKAADRIGRTAEKFAFEKKAAKVARMVQERSFTEWAEAVRRTFGIEVKKELYTGGSYEQEVMRWISDNAARARSLPMDALLEIERIIEGEYRKGTSPDRLGKLIGKKCSAVLARAEHAGADQISLLNTSLSRMYQRQAGVKRYVWLSAGDRRVRDCHRKFSGHIFSWDEPPYDWYITMGSGMVYTGRRYHPGEAPGCRCVAVPLFERETFAP